MESKIQPLYISSSSKAKLEPLHISFFSTAQIEKNWGSEYGFKDWRESHPGELRLAYDYFDNIKKYMQYKDIAVFDTCVQPYWDHAEKPIYWFIWVKLTE